MTGGFNWTVWGSGPSDVWTAGIYVSHWDGTAWSRVEANPGGQSLLYQALWGSGPSDVWLAGSPIGDFGDEATGIPPRGVSALLHYDGSTWSRSTDKSRYDVAGCGGSGPGDLWTAGDIVQHGAP